MTHSNGDRSALAWPPQKVETLRFLVDAGMHSFRQIGDLMGITKNAVIGKARRLDLNGPRMTGPAEKAPSTLNSRLDALNAELDAILAAPRPEPAPDKPRPHLDSPEFVARRRSA